MSTFGAIAIQPRDAQDFWSDKVPMSAKEYEALEVENRSRAFFISGLAKGDLLGEIKISLDKALAEGITFEQWKRDISAEIEKKGWASFKPYRLENIYRTNMQSAYMAGRYSQMKKNSKVRPYWQILSVNDSRTRPTHAAMHGLTYPADHEFWDTYYPPNGYRCRCTVKSLSQRQVEMQDIKVLDDTNPLIESKEYGLVNITPPLGFNRNVGKDWWATVRDLPDPKKHPEAYAEAQKHSPKDIDSPVIKPVKTNKELGRQLEKFGQDFISHGKPVRIGFKRANYFMATYSDGRILISNKTQRFDGLEFNPMRELKNAWNNIANGKKISWLEEYSIESFWHEVQHNRQKVGKPMTRKSQVMMETVNQWYSRRTYQKFLKSLGADPAHQDDIKKKGLGYTRYVQNFDKFLNKLNISEESALDKISVMHSKCDRADYINNFASWIKKERPALKPQTIKMMLNAIESPKDYYIELLDNFKDK